MEVISSFPCRENRKLLAAGLGFTQESETAIDSECLDEEILKRFIFDVCGCAGDWAMAQFVRESVAAIRALGKLGDAGCVGALAKQISVGGETTSAAQTSLTTLADKAAGPAMVLLPMRVVTTIS